MLEDILIDTNVLKHANDSNTPYQTDSIELINAMIDTETLLCVDEGFTLDETQNRSHIGHEYLKHLKHGSLGHALLRYLFLERRYRFLPRQIPPAITRQINQQFGNRRDRIFLRVAYNSTEKVLISHDYTDFSIPRRQFFSRSLGIIIEPASEGTNMLH